MIEKRNHIAEIFIQKEVEGIQVHEYGAHIFIPVIKNLGLVHQFATFNAIPILSCELQRGDLQLAI